MKASFSTWNGGTGFAGLACIRNCIGAVAALDWRDLHYQGLRSLIRKGHYTS